MPGPVIESLLILQDRDRKKAEIERGLNSIPSEIGSIESEIEEEKRQLDEKRGRVRELEVGRKDREGQIEAIEVKIARSKTQQLEVKKNEEYQALTKEIEIAEGKKGELEEAVLEILFELDSEREALAAIEKDFETRIEKLREKIRGLEERKERLTGELAEQVAEVESAREAVVDRRFLSVYDRQSKLVKFPIVAEIVDRTCQGCFLRVSGGTFSEAKEKNEVTTCESCGRIVYSQ